MLIPDVVVVSHPAACALRDGTRLHPELLSDWRVHFSRACSPIRDLAVEALRRAGTMPAVPADAAPELAELEHRLGAA
jgi:hypothetical protein